MNATRLPLRIWLVIGSAVGCLAGLLAADPQERFVAALSGAVAPPLIYYFRKLLWATAVWARRRNWLQFDLQGLLLLVMVCAAGLAIWDRWLRPGREQRQFITAVQGLGGGVYIEEDHTLRVSLPNMTDNTLAALTSLPGRRGVSSLGFNRSDITNAGLVHLLKFPELTTVYFDQCPITDEGVDVLVRIPKLHSIGAGKCLITDGGMRKFQVLPRLYVFAFADCPVTDEGVCWLAKRRELRSLGFKNTQITRQKMAELKQALPFSQVSFQ